MLTFFRNNQFSNALLLGIYAALLHIPAILDADKLPVYLSNAGVAARPLLELVQSFPILGVLSTIVLIWLQAIGINQLANNFRIDAQRTYFAGFFYVLFASLIPEFWTLSPQLLAISFLILSLYRLFDCYKNQQRVDVVFDAALWIMVGAMFYPPMLYLLLPAYIGIGLLRSFSFREKLVFFAGIVAVIFLSWVYEFWTDHATDYFQTQFGPLAKIVQFEALLSPKFWMKIAILGILALIGLLYFGSLTSKKLIQVQKYMSILYWFFFTAAGAYFIQRYGDLQHFLLVIPALSIFFALIFQSIKNKPIAELLHLVMLILIFFIYYFPI